MKEFNKVIVGECIVCENLMLRSTNIEFTENKNE